MDPSRDHYRAQVRTASRVASFNLNRIQVNAVRLSPLAIADQQDIQHLDRSEGGHQSLFSGREPVEHALGGGSLLTGKAPRQGQGGVEYDAYGRASSRSLTGRRAAEEKPVGFAEGLEPLNRRRLAAFGQHHVDHHGPSLLKYLGPC
jgi:hypothetical protein